MRDFVLNPMSCAGQFVDDAGLNAELTNLLDCFIFLRPAVAINFFDFYFDACFLNLSLTVGGESFAAAIRDRDLRTRFFSFVGQAKRVREEHEELVLWGQEGGSIGGLCSSQLLELQNHYLFSGTGLAGGIQIGKASSPAVRTSITPVYNLAELKALVPIFEASPKHRKEPYTTRDGEYVSEMELSDADAQECLTASLATGNQRFGKLRGRYYRFVRTHPNRNVFHGFRVERSDVPEDLAHSLDAVL